MSLLLSPSHLPLCISTSASHVFFFGVGGFLSIPACLHRLIFSPLMYFASPQDRETEGLCRVGPGTFRNREGGEESQKKTSERGHVTVGHITPTY